MTFSRRSFLKAGTATALTGLCAASVYEAATANINTNSKPSELEITNLRARMVGRAPRTIPLIRIDTNQGIYGLGEARDDEGVTGALQMKMQLVGENPCSFVELLSRIRQNRDRTCLNQGAQAVEMALWDLAGKAYSVPVYQMLGGKARDSVRLCAAIDKPYDPEEYDCRLKARLDEGFTWLKMEAGTDSLHGVPDTLIHPLVSGAFPGGAVVYLFAGNELTDKGIELIADCAARVRETVGMKVPLSMIFSGSVGVDSCIRLGRALEQYKPAWLEDLIPWNELHLWKEVTDALAVPTATGRDISRKGSFEDLCQNNIVDIIRPDLAKAGGMLEAKEIGNMAQAYGTRVALYSSGGPVSFMASLHCAAASTNFLVLEFRPEDLRGWGDLMGGWERPLVCDGMIKVPEQLGLGISVNEDAMRGTDD